MEKVNKADCEFVRLTEQNIHWFIPLYKAAFKKNISINELMRKYNHSAWEMPMLGLFAMFEGKPIGFIGGCYLKIVYREAVEWALDLTDSMIHPKYQKLNFYLNLLEEMENLAFNQGCTFALGFPNKNSYYPVVVKRKWEVPNQMIGYKIPLRSHWYSHARKVINPSLAISKIYSNEWIDEFKELKIQYDDRPSVIHDELFYNHRHSKLHCILRLKFGHAWIKAGKYLFVGLMTENRPEEFMADVRELQYRLRDCGYNQLIIQFDKLDERNKVLQSKFESFESWPILIKNSNSMFNLNQINIQFCDTDSFF